MSLDLPVHSQEIRGSRFGGSPSLAAQPRTQPEAAEPRRPAAHPACDFCRGALRREERHRLVWDSGLGGDLMLADLCGRCAAEVDRLLALYGGHGRNAIRLTQANAVAAPERVPARKVGGIAVRGLVYLLIALASFLLVTFVTARG